MVLAAADGIWMFEFHFGRGFEGWDVGYDGREDGRSRVQVFVKVGGFRKKS